MSVIDVMERRQIPIYLGGLAAGAAAGLAWPAGGSLWELCIYPVLGALLYATFLQVPFTKIAGAFKDSRFLTAVLVLNFAIVPLVVWALTAFLPLTQAVLLGVLLALLTPCIDYVIVFCGLAGGDHLRLLAAAPLLMLAQMLALPGFLWLFVGSDLADIVEIGPFLEAFLILIVLPLALAWATETLGNHHPSGQKITSAMNAAMVPLMTATLFVVVASQFPKIADQTSDVLRVVPIYAAFLIIMAPLGLLTARLWRLDPGRANALTFSGATRNSLVVLPLALALPDAFAITPVIVVTQTLVELLGMVLYVRLIPRLTRLPRPTPQRDNI
ncbi:ACR3 family arsenite efflux pump ArsB [Mycobacterium sp. BK558]|nr:ACR3 family arsenite efflux pump ArsB [Mycobacterium sp. BK558]